MGEHDDNPRVLIQGTDLERTFNYMEFLEDEDGLDEEVKAILSMLGNCFPTGTRRDVRGASLKQVKYVCLLAGFGGDQARQFCRVVNLAGGLDSLQAHYIINELLAAKNRSGKT